MKTALAAALAAIASTAAMAIAMAQVDSGPCWKSSSE